MNSSVKKSKVSDSAASIKTKQVTVKPSEIKTQEEDDDDNRPISSGFKKSADKPSTTKKIVTKVTKVNKSVSTSFKKQTKNKKTNSKQTKNKSKKSGSGSEYSKSTKLLPSSGDGQKKWTTLVHNGVIFPPPYQPHGVKMLYKGKPVDLTPEQEEVGFNI
jgi:DNA topoisomerase-1